MSTNPIDIIEKDISRHEEQIKSIVGKINDLSLTQAELGFLVKTYMEKIPVFEKKIDDLGDKIQKLMPDKQSWDMQKRVEDNERSIKQLFRLSFFALATVFVLVMVTPEAQQFLLGVIENKVP